MLWVPCLEFAANGNLRALSEHQQHSFGSSTFCSAMTPHTLGPLSNPLHHTLWPHLCRLHVLLDARLARWVVDRDHILVLLDGHRPACQAGAAQLLNLTGGSSKAAAAAAIL
jgi:hypothetical protein